MKRIEKEIRSELQIANQERYFGKHDSLHYNHIAELTSQLAEYRWNGYCKARATSQYRSSDYWVRLLEINFKTYSKLVADNPYSFIHDYIFKMENISPNVRKATEMILAVYYAIDGRQELSELPDEVKLVMPFVINLDVWRLNIVSFVWDQTPYFNPDFIEPMYIGMDKFQFDEDGDSESWDLCKISNAKELRSLMIATSKFLKNEQDKIDAAPVDHSFPRSI